MKLPSVKVDDLTIYYKIEGNGPPLLLLHGMGNNSRSWKYQWEDFREHFTVIAWDAPGYGQSSDPRYELRTFGEFAVILKKFVEALQIEPFSLLGHSMGSTLAMEFYKRYPQSVFRMIFANGTRGGKAKDGEQNEEKLKNRLKAIENLSPQELAKQRVSSLLSPYASDEVRKLAEEIYAQVRPIGYRSVSWSLFHADQTDILPNIQVPVLVICGEEDQVTPLAESISIHTLLPQSDLVVIPRAGHLSYMEDPKRFNQAVIDFLVEKGKSGDESK